MTLNKEGSKMEPQIRRDEMWHFMQLSLSCQERTRGVVAESQ